ncbi:hypothetical protein D8674_003844 [Pyrus ussuriensis x Pyrus communis]|uniref:Uncharacterized protein n=1 Tax=Pyrus ussuriensis x Pyrus communis TaxID=2448454 RepID=A0A5N5FI69_9ROSA|nr:hypothetical protein D8674_003844 [Pyrus ussuriensis x Pyrus communis]
MYYLCLHITILLKEKMDKKKNTAMEEQNEVNDWVIYKVVIGGPSHGRLLGVGVGFSTKDQCSKKRPRRWAGWNRGDFVHNGWKNRGGSRQP